VTIPGVDLSSFQGAPGSWRSEAGNISWAAVKLTELEPGGGRYVNPDAAADWAALKAAGKGRIAYLFGHPSVSAAASVAFFGDELRSVGLEDGDGVALDLEVTDGRPPADVAAWGCGVLGQLGRQLDRRPLLYTFLSFAGSGNCAGMGGYPLWIADPSSPAGHPRVPAPWKTWEIHQHSITGGIDRDVAAWADLAALRKALGKKEPAVTLKAYVTTGRESWTEIAREHKLGAAHLLRLNGGPGEPFTGAIAAYINGGSLLAPMDAKITVRVPA
jgi:GH25 family lysozyme M1 (1,4-beta-N-acetylmuramidase)